MAGTEAQLPDDVAPTYVDTAEASIARVYDAFLDGKDNYEIDREVIRRIQRHPGDGPTACDQPGLASPPSIQTACKPDQVPVEELNL